MLENNVQQLRLWQQQGEIKKITDWIEQHPESSFSEDAALNAILAVYMFLQNNQQEAHHFFSQINEAELNNAAVLSDYALCCFVQGQKKSLEIINKATTLTNADSIAWARQGAMLMAQNKLDEAEQSFSHSLLLQPNRAEVLSNLAGIRVRQNKLEEALTLYNRALIQKKDLVIAEQQRSLVLIKMGEIDTLLDEKQALLEKSPDNIDLHRQLANLQIQANQFQEALATLNAAVEKFPQHFLLKLDTINLLSERKQTHVAGCLIKDWLENKDWLEEYELEEAQKATDKLRLLLNKNRIDAGFLEAAEQDLMSMEEELKNSPDYLLTLAQLYEEQNNAEQAITLLKKTIEQYSGLTPAYHQLAHALTSLGRLDEAEQYSDSISSINPSSVIQYVENHGYQANETELKSLKELLHSPLLPIQNRASAGFTLHKVLEKKKNYSEAFEALIEANELTKTTLNYRWQQHRKETQNLISVFNPQLVEKLSGLGLPSQRPIFVVGMPRSGTTLTEQIISSHSKVFGAGELGWMGKIKGLMKKVVDNGNAYPFVMNDLTEFHLKSAAQYYLEKIALLDDEKAHVVDKMPHNFDNVGLIALAFPNAKIIQLDRDPRDNAISNYQQNFGAKQGTMGFAFDLEWIGEMLNDHDEIMRHWKLLFPNRIYTLNYQQLVNNPDTIIRELIEYCELPWEDQCLNFYENKSQVRTASIRQVRQKMYTSSAEKWRRYEDYLTPLNKILSAGYKKLTEDELQQDDRGIKPLGLNARTH